MKSVPMNCVNFFPFGPRMPHTKSSSPPTTISMNNWRRPGIIELLRDAKKASRETIATIMSENIMFS